MSYFYAPQGNTLMKVNDLAYHEGFKNGANGVDDYAYDFNGNLIKDLNKQIVEIKYNHLNLPTYIEHADQYEGTLTFVYSATGEKQKKIFEISDYTPTSYMHRETYYAGDFIYERYWDYSTTQPFPSAKLKMFFQPEGYVEPVDPNDYSQGFRYVYQYRDQVNSVRLSYSDSDGNGSIDPATEIWDEKNYYPFGLEHQGYNGNVIGSENDYKTYQGQEFTDELGLNVHEWKYRISDPAIGRFWQIDPLAEDYTYNSPYAFQENKLGMGIELEGAESVGFDVVQYFILEHAQFEANVSGARSQIGKAVDNRVEALKTGQEKNKASVAGYNVSQVQDVMAISDGVGIIQQEALNTTKQVVRDGANVAEIAGDAMVIAAPLTGPVAPVVAATGAALSTVGTATNIALDVAEGDYESAGERIVIEAVSGGLSAVAKQLDEVTERAVNSHITVYENITTATLEKAEENCVTTCE